MSLVKTPDGFEYYKVNEKYIPEKWTNDPKEFDDFPSCPNREDYKFPAEKQIPIIANSSAFRYLFKAGNDFYFWWALAGRLQLIEAPTDIKGILQLMQSGKVCQTKVLSSDSGW